MTKVRLYALAHLAVLFFGLGWQPAQAQLWDSSGLRKLPDRRAEFVRQCVPHMVGRWAHPDSVCACLHDHAVTAVEDQDLREALLRGISERGVPSIDKDWIPASKRPLISATFSQIAKPTLQCMYDPTPD
jgi:hypothetical protein